MIRLFYPKPLSLAVCMALAASYTYAQTTSLGKTCLFCDAQSLKQHTSIPIQRSGEEAPPADYVRITADEVDGKAKDHIRATGNVIIERNTQTINAPVVEYQQTTDTVHAKETFTLNDQDTTIRGENLNYRLADGNGTAQNIELEHEQNHRRLQASSNEATIINKHHYSLKEVQFNTCQKGDASWYLHASEVEANHQSGIGMAKNVRLVFGGLPVFYTPWLDFPLNGNRKSGFLIPQVEVGSDGTSLHVPYYFNLAPNYDATLHLGGISSRGVQLGGEFRYLQPRYRGNINAWYMPHDNKTQYKHRSHIQFNHQHQVNDKTQAGIDFNQVSDSAYYRDFYNRNDIASHVNLDRRAWIQHQDTLWQGKLKTSIEAQKYQTLADSNGYKDSPYAIMPRISSLWQRHVAGYESNVLAQFTRFEHPEKQSGNRFIIYPSISRHFQTSWGYIRPKVGVHYTHYQLNQSGSLDKRQVSRTLPIANIDAGMTFERPIQWFKQTGTQTLEPRLFYNYIPTQAQNHLPNFDSAENSFHYEQLFRENLYSGGDRINPSNSLTTAIQTRLINEHGEEKFRAGIGQKFYLKSDNILLDGSIGQHQRNRSDWIAFADGKITDNLNARTVLHYNNNNKQLQNIDTGLVYQTPEGQSVGIRYKYGRDEPIYLKNDGEYHFDTLKQVSMGVQWPIQPNLTISGRLNYDLDRKRLLEQSAGFEYHSQCGCWGASFTARRFANGIDKNHDSTYKNGVMFSLQLKDLSSLGNRRRNLEPHIPGYNILEENKQE